MPFWGHFWSPKRSFLDVFLMIEFRCVLSPFGSTFGSIADRLQTRSLEPARVEAHYAFSEMSLIRGDLGVIFGVVLSVF